MDFYTVNPSILDDKLLSLGLDYHLCNWLKEFLSNRTQQLRLGDLISSNTIHSTDTPQDYILSPLLYSLFTHDCSPIHNINYTYKFADDTALVELIINNDEAAFREEVQVLTSWCQNNDLFLNTNKTKELVIDFKKHQNTTHASPVISGEEVEKVGCFKHVGVHHSEDLTWGRPGKW